MQCPNSTLCILSAALQAVMDADSDNDSDDEEAMKCMPKLDNMEDIDWAALEAFEAMEQQVHGAHGMQEV